MGSVLRVDDLCNRAGCYHQRAALINNASVWKPRFSFTRRSSLPSRSSSTVTRRCSPAAGYLRATNDRLIQPSVSMMPFINLRRNRAGRAACSNGDAVLTLLDEFQLMEWNRSDAGRNNYSNSDPPMINIPQFSHSTVHFDSIQIHSVGSYGYGDNRMNVIQPFMIMMSVGTPESSDRQRQHHSTVEPFVFNVRTADYNQLQSCIGLPGYTD